MEEMSLTPSELLHAYMDGELDAGLETSLFAALNNNMDLRTEMRELLALRNAVKRDRAVLVPPLTATAGVFGALGMSAPYAIGTGSVFGALWARFVIPALVGITCATIAWLGLESTQGSANRLQTSSSSVVTPKQSVTDVTQTPKRDNTETTTQPTTQIQKSITGEQIKQQTVVKYIKVPVEKIVYRDRVVYKDKIVYQDKVVYKDNIVYREKIVYRDKPENNNNMAFNSNATSQTVNENSSYNELTPAVNHTSINSSQTPVAPVVIPNATPLGMASKQVPVATAPSSADDVRRDAEMQAALPRELYRWNVQFRGLTGNSLVNIQKQPESGISFNNIAIGIMYQLTDNHFVGIEFGREPYGLKYSGIYNSLAAQYELHPSLYYASVAYQGRFDAGSGVYPFVQTNFGGTEYGYVAKGILGIQYMPIPNFGVMGGFEPSNLWYQFQGNSFKTTKLGFTYGISYQF